jgi:hypothetical protein
MTELVVYYKGEYTSTTEPVVYKLFRRVFYCSMTELVVFCSGEYTSTTVPVVYKLYRRVYWHERACGIHTMEENTIVWQSRWYTVYCTVQENITV